MAKPMSEENHEKNLLYGKAVVNLHIAVDAFGEAYEAMYGIDLEDLTVHDGARPIDVMFLRRTTERLEEMVRNHRAAFKDRVKAEMARASEG